MLDNEPNGVTNGDAAGTEQERSSAEQMTEEQNSARRRAARPAGPPPEPEDTAPPAVVTTPPPAQPPVTTGEAEPAARVARPAGPPPEPAEAPRAARPAGPPPEAAEPVTTEAAEPTPPEASRPAGPPPEAPAVAEPATTEASRAARPAGPPPEAPAAEEPVTGEASRPAGPPPEEGAEPAAEEKPARRRRASGTTTTRSRTRTTKKAAEAADEAPSTEPAEAESPAAGTEQEAAKPARRRRTRTKAEPEPTAEAETAAEPAAEAETAEAAPGAPEAGATGVPAVPAVPAPAAETPAEAAESAAGPSFLAPVVMFRPPEPAPAPAPSRPWERANAEDEAAEEEPAEDVDETDEDEGDEEERSAGRRRRRRGGRGRSKKPSADAESGDEEPADKPADEAKGDAKAEPKSKAKNGKAQESKQAEEKADEKSDDTDADGTSRRRRRRRRRAGSADADSTAPDDPENTVVKIRPPRDSKIEDEVQSLRGSTRLEAKKQRRREGREQGRRRPPIITESEFLARRESVDRVMAVRQVGDRTQIGVLEDNVLVEHYVDRSSQQSYVGNVYLGKVQNVLPSMEAAFVDIGKGRNAVLYAGEVNFDATGLEGQPKRIESALKSGQSVLVQVTKDPVGHKGARLTSQVSLPGRYLVYVPEGSMTGISRKLPDSERSRLKQILKKVMPEDAGVIVRTAAEGASEEELAGDIQRLAAQWEQIKKKAKTASAPSLLHGEPDMTVRVVRDIFNEDFKELIVEGGAWETVHEYVNWVAPSLAERLRKWDGDRDLFEAYRIDEQIAKALERKVWLPSGGSLVIDRTEAMTVIDVNTGKFTGQGGNLEETVTKNNLEAAEEIVRQLRLRDIGGIIVIDFIDMVLEANRDLVLRRLLECLSRDRTKHQVAEVTSLGLVQMTRKRVGQGLLEAFSETCEHCNGRGIIVHTEPVEPKPPRGVVPAEKSSRRRKKNGKADEPAEPPAADQSSDEQGPDDEESPVEAVAEAAEAVSDIVAERAGATVEPVNGVADKPKRRRSRRTKTEKTEKAEHAAVGE